jgi:hypothetical protein
VNDNLIGAAIFLVVAFFAGVWLGGNKRADMTAQAACGECSEVRECGSLVCVPGKGWQESTK